MLYFAYGSNMDPEQMKGRCPAAEIVGIGVLRDHGLCFPRGSLARGCGVASVEPLQGRETWGVVYRLSAADLAALDQQEGFRSDRPAQKNNYNRTEVLVDFGGVRTPMLAYVAVPQNAPPLPSAAYLRHMRAGARHHRLPPAYIRYLDGLACASSK